MIDDDRVYMFSSFALISLLAGFVSYLSGCIFFAACLALVSVIFLLMRIFEE